VTRVTGTAATAALFVLLTGTAPAPAPSGSDVIATVQARNASLPNFTFHADVAVAMSHFPWLHFHLIGDGHYDRGEHYVVHFTRMPWFASKVHDIDLSMLDPTMWPKNYSYTQVGTDGPDTLFDLQALHDPTLVKAEVAMTCQGADWVDATYTDGMHIRMHVVPSETGGFMLPTKLDASIDYPHMPLSAKADFTNYRFTASNAAN
jgi:hypothetical protein